MLGRLRGMARSSFYQDPTGGFYELDVTVLINLSEQSEKHRRFKHTRDARFLEQFVFT